MFFVRLARKSVNEEMSVFESTSTTLGARVSNLVTDLNNNSTKPTIDLIQPPTKKRKVQSSSYATNALNSGESNNSNVPLKHKAPSCDRQPNWAELPPEIWVKIFGHLVDAEETAVPTLVTTSKVCNAWRSASYVPTLWKSLRFSAAVIKNQNEMRKSAKSFEKLASRCFHRVDTLQCIGLPKITNLLVSSVAKYSEALTDVSLRQCGRVTYKSCMQSLLDRHGASMQNFSLLNTDMSSLDLNKLIQGFGSALRSLQIVNPEQPRDIRIPFIRLENLTELKLDSPRFFELWLLKGLRRLKVLHLINMRIDTKGTGELEWPDLEDIDVRFHQPQEFLTQRSENRTLARILATATKLKHVCFRYRTVDVEFFLHHLQECRIEYLDISGFYGCTIETVMFVLGQSLQELYLDNFKHLDRILLLSSDYTVWESLRFLSIENTDITEDVFRHLLRHLHSIEKINLSRCRGLPRGWKRLWTDITQLKSLVK